MVDGVRVSSSPSFGVFSLSHPLRRRCLALVQNPWFDAATVAVTLLSCVALALDTPDLDANSPMTAVLAQVRCEMSQQVPSVIQ
jgi:hypothetical protein